MVQTLKHYLETHRGHDPYNYFGVYFFGRKLPVAAVVRA